VTAIMQHHDLLILSLPQFLQHSMMATALTPTTMTAEEMVPDTQNPDHDPQYWCLPPVRDEPIGGQRCGYPMYLVTQGRSVGVWHNW
jgi:hypothetical protein